MLHLICIAMFWALVIHDNDIVKEKRSETKKFQIVDSITFEPLCGVKIVDEENKIYYSNIEGEFETDGIGKKLFVEYISYQDTLFDTNNDIFYLRQKY